LQIRINAAFEEGDSKYFLKALRNVAEAHGGMAELARKADLNRETLYRTLSEKGNPRLDSLCFVLKALGLNLKIGTTHKSKKKSANKKTAA
jgi:probable addiction module antidote protein